LQSWTREVNASFLYRRDMLVFVARPLKIGPTGMILEEISEKRFVVGVFWGVVHPPTSNP